MKMPPCAERIPRAAEVIRIWRSNGIAWSTIQVYLRWVCRFLENNRRSSLMAEESLRKDLVKRWAARRAHRRGTDPTATKRSANIALWAWSWGLKASGYIVPEWNSPSAQAAALPPLLDAFVKYRLEVRGVAESTIRRDLEALNDFLSFIRRRGRNVTNMQLADVDRYLNECSTRLARRTLARIVYVLRSFLRFLYISDRTRHDLSSAVIVPRIRRSELPPRALPWCDVRRIFKAVNKRTDTGKRDYALLLMMAAYGLGAGEVRGLTLDSVDWRQRQVRVVRPKTGRTICLPLLPGVARALSSYLRFGRPRHCTSRALFVQMHAPYGKILSSSAICHILRNHAISAGVSAKFLGSHVLRHSHASRQIDLGASAAVVGEILGHRRPESTSVYVRVALRRLRMVALPVPQ